MSSLIQSMMPRLPSGSSLERAKNCPGSFHAIPVDSTTEAALTGTANHERVEISLDLGNIDQVPKSAMVYVEDHLRAGLIETEVAYALDVETGEVRKLGTKLGRNYPATNENEIRLTVDLVGPGVVGDWKSRTRVTKAENNLQIGAGVYCAWVLQGKPERMVGFLSYLSDGYTDAAEFDFFKMVGLLEELRSIVRRVKSWTKERGLHEGDWCKYCPAWTTCEPKKALIAYTVNGLAEGAILAAINAGNIAGAHELLKSAEDALERVARVVKEGVFREFEKGTPVQLSSGKRLVVVQESRNSMDQAAVKKVFAELGEEVPMKKSTFDKVVERV